MLKSTYKPPPPLPAGWTEHKAPAGHSYYYNAVTQESTYKRPYETAQGHLPQPAVASLAEAQLKVFSLHNPNALHAGYGVFQRSFQHGDPNPGRGGFGGRYNEREQPFPQDRPKSKHPIPGCAPWLLVKTKLGRRFVYNPEKGESFWKFPLDVMKGLVEYDRLERENKSRMAEIEDAESENVDAAAADEGEPNSPGFVLQTAGNTQRGNDTDEFEEVEVTDDDDLNSSKRQKTGDGDLNQPVEFNEDDIAYQLAAMGQGYEIDPGEYGREQDESWDGAQSPILTEEDANALFKDMLDDHNINPYTTWENVIEAGQIVEDERYTVLQTMKSRKESWVEWSRDKIQRLKEQREREEKNDPRISYFSFLQSHATPKLYWPEFRRKYKNEPALRNAKFSDKEREKSYREYINRLKLPESTLKSDLVKLLKSIPLHNLNQSTAADALPGIMLSDLRYISLHPSIRDPLVETYISTLAPAPSDVDILPEEEEALLKQREERGRREKALADRQKQVIEAKRGQQGALRYSKEMLMEGEEEIQRAMKVGRMGLRSYMDLND